jgi:predicted DNA-binding WGR domain protein
MILSATVAGNDEGMKSVNKKWCLLKTSDGQRGLNGKKKVYEIRVEGTKVTFEWGMAEKVQRQRQVRVCRTEQAALSLAYEKLDAKRYGGYSLAYAV